jgi:hypothetical protein
MSWYCLEKSGSQQLNQRAPVIPSEAIARHLPQRDVRDQRGGESVVRRPVLGREIAHDVLRDR